MLIVNPNKAGIGLLVERLSQPAIAFSQVIRTLSGFALSVCHGLAVNPESFAKGEESLCRQN
jgi:hypothetical protein